MDDSKTEKMKILTRMTKKLRDPTFKKFNKHPMKRAMHLTGLNEKFLNDLIDHGSELKMYEKIDRSIIYDSLTDFYLTKRTIPTTRQLFDSLYDKLPPYMDIDTFRKMLKKLDFAWKYIAVNRFVVIEKPKAVFDRYMYLTAVSEARQDGKKILYVDENVLDTKGNLMPPQKGSNDATSFTYAVSDTGVHGLQITNNHDETTFRNWIENFMFEISEPSVFVIKNTKHHNTKLFEIPAKTSDKIDMIEWLESNDIPCDSNMETFELYDLIESHTDMEDEYVIDKIIERNGHKLLRIPNCIRNLTPAALFLKFFNENCEMMKVSPMHRISCVPESMFKNFTEYICEHEKKIMELDMKVDAILDEIVKNVDVCPVSDESDSDVPSSSDEN